MKPIKAGKETSKYMKRLDELFWCVVHTYSDRDDLIDNAGFMLGYLDGFNCPEGMLNSIDIDQRPNYSYIEYGVATGLILNSFAKDVSHKDLCRVIKDNDGFKTYCGDLTLVQLYEEYCKTDKTVNDCYAYLSRALCILWRKGIDA